MTSDLCFKARMDSFDGVIHRQPVVDSSDSPLSATPFKTGGSY